ncbi:MAG: GerMN domain-containing protein [Spirochaetales bacterium]|nr:GerMN domain-containing protein [Spirochaetales bacterium]
MEARSWKPLLISSGLFALILATAAALFILGGRWEQRVLFFPGLDTVELSGESRFLPRRQSLEGRVRLLAEEVVLGPSSPALRRYVPRETEIQSVIVRQGVAYVSVSRHLLQGTDHYRGTTGDALQALANTILYNVPRLRKLYLLVDGQLPRAAEAGFEFSRKALR